MLTFFCYELSWNSDPHPVPKQLSNLIVAKQRMPIWNADQSKDIPVMTIACDYRECTFFHILFYFERVTDVREGTEHLCHDDTEKCYYL